MPKYFRPASCLALLLGLGLLGNYFKYPLFLNIDFLFGSIFALVALQVLGWGRGVLAAAIIASYTFFLWNHPYYMVIVTAEVAVVGFLMARYKVGLVLADALYWVAIGMPLSYLLYRGALEVPVANAFLVTCKSAMNGIANALIARLLVTGLSAWLLGKRVAFRDIAYNLFALFALAPALTLMVLASRSDFNEIDKDIRTDLSADGKSMASRVDVWLQNRIFAATHLAHMASQRTPAEMQAPLEQAQASDSNFTRVTLINALGLSVAISPLVDEQGRSNLGRNYADRPFIPQLKKTLKPMVSEVVFSRVETQKPIALVVSPVVAKGDYAGFIAGILSLSQVEDFIASNAKATHVRYALIDKNSNIILTNHPDQKVMTPLRRSLQPETKAVLRDMQGRIHSMALLHESLYRSGTFASVDLGDYLTQLVNQLFNSQKPKGDAVKLRLQLMSAGLSVSVGMDQAIPCGLLINELVSNSLQHGFPNDHSGEISVTLQAVDTQASLWRLSVTDTGAGLAPDFEDRRKASLGLQLASDLARQLGSILEITSNKSEISGGAAGANGVTFSVTFKAIQPAPLVMPA